MKPSLFHPLEPGEALAEILAGLVMVLTFTLAAGWLARDADGGPKSVVIAALGCNIAWGFIDAAIYLLGRTTLRSYRAHLLRSVQFARNEDAAEAAIRGEWEPALAEAAREEDRERLYSAMRQIAQNAKPLRTGLRRDDLKGALFIFLLMCATTAPALLPFLFLRNDWLALRISNLLLVVLLFFAGHRWATYTDASPLLTGLALVALGLTLVGIAVALGG